MLAEFTSIKHKKGNLIYAPGHEDDIVFIVKEGRIRLYLAVEDKDFSLAILEPGDIYASHTRAHVETLDDVTLLVMPTARLHAYMASHPALSKTIISILGELLKQSFSIIDSLVFKDIKQRLVDFFLYEVEHNGIKDSTGTTIQLKLTNTQLAAIIGSSRQTVSTIIGSMLKEGALEKRARDTYYIPNVDFLRNYGQV